MEIGKMLAGIVDCPCGRPHTCDIHTVEIGNEVLQKLPSVCEPFSNICLIADGNTYPLCGDAVASLLGAKLEGKQIFGTSTVIPDEDSVAQIEERMSGNTDLLIGIGSGVINDLCKYVSFTHGIRYIIIATAPSMDGYASVGAAMILHQMKVTVNARVPYAIFAESDIVRTAPMDMIRSGYGDIVGKYSCLNDWKLAHLILGEYFCQKVYDEVLSAVKRTENTATALLRRDREAIRNLTEALVTVGVLMSYVGNSRPASGSEHHLSHFFEITGLLDHKPYYLHGIDVLYSSAVTAGIREKLLTLTPPFAPFIFNRTAWEKDIRRIYGTAADGVIALQDKVGFYRTQNTALYAEKWDAVRNILREAPTAAQTDNYIRSIGLDRKDFDTFYGKEKILDAVRFAKDLKDRFTVLWISFLLNQR